MTDSARLALPFLEPGQSQKEWTHNEALALLDIAVQASVESIGINVPPANPPAGTCWIVGDAPSGAWSGHAGAVAGWTQGGWRFVAARPGMAAWSLGDATFVRYGAQGWRLDRSVPIAAPAGGEVVDGQCRVAVAAILDVLARQGWLA